ncbi:Uncharacterized protein PODLI_1B003743 [Podarcis lilfordi]|uniref:Uncharacterized protein n=1 Tax=Podarcis lilfordi TaxID=74358 RepID=A0AA35L2M6_9SAUR|nr:Uncharacterized protein PODLI_1B003743 [Podarcis lilfordi]
MTDGFHMTWSVKFDGNGGQPEKPHLDSRSLVFELDPCRGNGKVCLVYKNTKPGVTPYSAIWLLDRALYWHFLTKPSPLTTCSCSCLHQLWHQPPGKAKVQHVQAHPLSTPSSSLRRPIPS